MAGVLHAPTVRAARPVVSVATRIDDANGLKARLHGHYNGQEAAVLAATLTKRLQKLFAMFEFRANDAAAAYELQFAFHGKWPVSDLLLDITLSRSNQLLHSYNGVKALPSATANLALLDACVSFEWLGAVLDELVGIWQLPFAELFARIEIRTKAARAGTTIATDLVYGAESGITRAMRFVPVALGVKWNTSQLRYFLACDERPGANQAMLIAGPIVSKLEDEHNECIPQVGDDISLGPNQFETVFLARLWKGGL